MTATPSTPPPYPAGPLTVEQKAELYDHMRAVALANGFDSITQAIAEAHRARELKAGKVIVTVVPQREPTVLDQIIEHGARCARAGAGIYRG